MNESDGFVELPVDDVDLGLLGWGVAKKVYHSVDRVGLAPRGLASKVDDKVMGDLGSTALGSWLNKQYGLSVTSYDDVRNDDFRNRDPGWDLAVSSEPFNHRDWRKPWDAPAEIWTISVKSSRVPAKDGNAFVALRKRDFKIMKYSSSIQDDLHADIEVQIYFPHDSLPLMAVINQGDIEKSQLSHIDAEELISRIGGVKRFSPCLLVAAVSAQRLATRVCEDFVMPGLGKKFWKAPLAEMGSSAIVLAENLMKPKKDWVRGGRLGGWMPQPINPEVR